jgi:hypothetical protein
MASFNKFDCFVLDVANALHDMKTGTTHVYRVYLTNTAPVATNTIYNTPADLSTAFGYTAGGVSIGTITGSQTSGTFKFIGGTDPAWTASGGSMGRIDTRCFTISRRRQSPSSAGGITVWH